VRPPARPDGEAVTPAHFLALVAATGFALFPRRLWFLTLPALAGWIVVWSDGSWTGHWLDSPGAATTALCLLLLVFSDGYRDSRPGDAKRSTERETARSP
jgi:hypothetical protein